MRKSLSLLLIVFITLSLASCGIGGKSPVAKAQEWMQKYVNTRVNVYKQAQGKNFADLQKLIRDNMKTFNDLLQENNPMRSKDTPYVEDLVFYTQQFDDKIKQIFYLEVPSKYRKNAKKLLKDDEEADDYYVVGIITISTDKSLKESLPQDIKVKEIESKVYITSELPVESGGDK